MAVAERFGQLPTTVENELDEYWLNRIAVYMEAQNLDAQRKDREFRSKARK